jgi:hypothetical protein
VDEHGHVVLAEKTREGKATGTFDGDRDASGAIAGTWRAAGNGHSAPFTLAPIPRATGPGPVLVFKRAFHNQDQTTERHPSEPGNDQPTGCDIKVEYPEVFGLASAEVEAKINAALSAENERECDQPCTGEWSYGVTLNRDGVLSVDVGGEHVCAFAAHPSNYEGFSANFLTRTGERLGLDQVFKRPFSVYAKKLFQKAIDEAIPDEARGTSKSGPPRYDSNELDEAFYRDMLEGVFASPEFLFVDGGVEFTVARALPHAFQALGAEPTKLTYAQLKDALDPSSPVAFLWRK